MVVQKATEPGVTRIMPVTSAALDPQLEAMEMRAITAGATRWQKIAREASRQLWPRRRARSSRS